ncbi:serine/threonine protein kinase [Erythrobacter sp. EC-HK427]|uniref:serine/threonine protein kinase n=1 Tax=Erythrobacter sp. EC-HK427 TaxID=2038396 RepID=UPI00125918A2|nr:protein kinase [Erythrobacter sp. EC-HK427]VVT17894.1 conserved hypothetical protein [Erythrobacter sp. EC-HK427]
MSGKQHEDDDGEKTVIRTPGSAAAASPSGSGDREEDEGRTIIRPDTASPTEENEDDQRTVIAPAAGAAPEPEIDRTIIAAQAPQGPAAKQAPPPAALKPPKTPISGITIGQVLNHTYEIKRFIARGGMGEVFEGVNVTNGQRVAVKVILPALASDPAVIEMFVKEATVLERLVHPALVNYRTQARDPEAGVFYIVTNFIEGVSLESLIGNIKPSLEELVGLTRRLAEGLSVAHSMGAIHRDIAPDNILLENGDLAAAQIIDFGIARDIDPGSNTVIGTGFAGKYSFVAPEQLGAFKSDVGPWSDIYSLGLVLLGLARGKTLKLGTSPVEANDLRKEGIDTSEAPRALRPLFDAMLVYNPARRLRSMDGVITLLDRIDVYDVDEDASAEDAAPGDTAGGLADEGYVPGRTLFSGGSGSGTADGTIAGLPRMAVFAGGGIVGVMLLVGLAMIAFGGGSDAPDIDVGSGGGGAQPALTANIDAAAATERAQTALASVDCHWLDLAVSGSPGALRLNASGVAGLPGAIEPAVFGALEGGGVSTDFSGVSPVPQSNCGVMDSLRPFRAPDDNAITQAQTTSDIRQYPANHSDPALAGLTGAIHTVDINLPGTAPIALLVLSDGQVMKLGSGTVLEIIGEDFRQSANQFSFPLRSETDETSWTTVILLEGNGQLDPAADALVSGNFAQFAQLAEANGIRTHMLWHQLVEIPGS